MNQGSLNLVISRVTGNQKNPKELKEEKKGLKKSTTRACGDAGTRKGTSIYLLSIRGYLEAWCVESLSAPSGSTTRSQCMYQQHQTNQETQVTLTRALKLNWHWNHSTPRQTKTHMLNLKMVTASKINAVSHILGLLTHQTKCPSYNKKITYPSKNNNTPPPPTTAT